MKIVRILEGLAGTIRCPVMTIGNFDGVHLGHRELFRRVVARAAEFEGESVVLTFDPHPLKFLAPDKAPALLNTAAEKQRLIAASHVDLLIEAPFTKALAEMTPEHFVDQILIDSLQAQALVIGYDYAFGRGRRGDAGQGLRQEGRGPGAGPLHRWAHPLLRRKREEGRRRRPGDGRA